MTLSLNDWVLQCGQAELSEWEEIVRKIKNPQGRIKVALVGRYVELPDAYMSVSEALHHAGVYHNVSVEIAMISSAQLG